MNDTLKVMNLINGIHSANLIIFFDDYSGQEK